jgi:putative SOS response-associated peptidase YedK
MCGRYVSVSSDADLLSAFDIDDVVDEGPGPSWNVAPTDPVRIIVKRSSHEMAPTRQLRTARWGLVPSWSRDRKGAARMINARIETVTQKRAFTTAAARRRCLIPAQGYYEWQQTDTGKIPHFLHDPSAGLLAMAGLYEFWPDPERAEDDPDRWMLSCTIITQQATDLLGEIHDRNPVIVPLELRESWLDCSSQDLHDAGWLLEQMPAAHLDTYVVGPAVGNVRNNGPELISPASP